MSGFFTILIAFFSIMTMGILVYMMDQSSYSEQPANLVPELTMLRSDKVNSQAEPAGGVEEDCKEDALAAAPGFEVKAQEAVNDEQVRNQETVEARESEGIKSLALPDMASLKIAGTAEVCTQ